MVSLVVLLALKKSALDVSKDFLKPAFLVTIDSFGSISSDFFERPRIEPWADV